jgi:hypothetical protein
MCRRQQELQIDSPDPADVLRIGSDLQAFFAGVRTGCNQFPAMTFVHLDHAKTTGGERFQRFVVAKSRDVNIVFSGDLQDGLPGSNSQLLPI